MTKANHYAAIYVRTSSEAQAEKASPDEQERDCRALAEQHGLTVIKVYTDTARYRVKGKMVDPSGTRADRPGLLAMLADAVAGQFGAIIAWREDRLYRGMRAMINVLETVQEHKITVLLARETFDAKIAPLKAWVAGMELEGMKERMSMGVKARLRAGKANTGQDRYGYKRKGDKIVIVEEEARWVRQIFAWYVARVPLLEIRRRLIAAGAPQKGASRPVKIQWSIAVIQAILQNATAYASGVKIQRRLGEAFEIAIPTIIDQDTLQRARERRQANRRYPAHHQKADYLLGGLIKCSCGRTWAANTISYHTERDGSQVERKVPRGQYQCRERHPEHISPDCPRSIGSKKADALAWAKVVQALDDPDLLIAGARARIEQLQREAESVLADRAAFESRLETLEIERQNVIRLARKGLITEDELSLQLAEIELNELNIRKELAELTQVIDVAALGEWETAARGFLADVKRGIDEANLTPQTDEERREVFQIRRYVVKTLVTQVTIDRERNLAVTIGLDVPALMQALAQIQLGGIYIHIQ